MLGRLKTWLALAGAAIIAFAAAFLRGRAAGKQDAKDDANADTIKRTQAGRDAVRDGRDDDPADRLRRNDGRW